MFFEFKILLILFFGRKFFLLLLIIFFVFLEVVVNMDKGWEWLWSVLFFLELFFVFILYWLSVFSVGETGIEVVVWVLMYVDMFLKVVGEIIEIFLSVFFMDEDVGGLFINGVLWGIFLWKLL